MPLPRLCGDEPLVKELRDVFRANVLRIPEARVAPLGVLVSRMSLLPSSRLYRLLGQINSLIGEPPPPLADGDIRISPMASLTNRRSRVLDNTTGIEILTGLLNGLSENEGAPEIVTHLRETNSFRFVFPSMERRYIEIGRIGELLAGRRLSSTNLLFPTLTDPRTSIQLIDSAITSTGFAIEAGDDDTATFRFNVDGLKRALGAAKITLDATDAKKLTFRSNRRVTFAFTCVTMTVDAMGAIRGIKPSTTKVHSPAYAADAGVEHGMREHVLLTKAPELLELQLD